MKPLRLLALTIAATAWCASAAFAGEPAKKSDTHASSCGSKSATATAAHAGCASKSTASAAAASPRMAASCPMSADQCKSMAASGACTPEMMAKCGAKGGRTAAAGVCDMHGMGAHADCAVCSDEMACDDDVRATGARAQVVPLRNGTMIVYTLDNTGNVRGLQAAVARYNERVVAALQGDAKLCGACKKLRGALASGKLVREVVNVERGCQVLITSTDRSIVDQVHACTTAQVAARTKS